MKVKQRTTTPVPGSDDRLLLTLDDITKGQVMTSLAPKNGGIVLAPTSMGKGSTAGFQLEGAAYLLTLKELHNALIGQDYALFEITEQRGRVLDEDARIERLLEAVAKLEGAVFIRNGAEHGPKEAAEHLRAKWNAKRKDVTSASRFIDLVATGSDVSGAPYRIRLPDGRTVAASEWLREKLGEMAAR
jgi:hypothetical protein